MCTDKGDVGEKQCGLFLLLLGFTARRMIIGLQNVAEFTGEGFGKAAPLCHR